LPLIDPDQSSFFKTQKRRFGAFFRCATAVRKARMAQTFMATGRAMQPKFRKASPGSLKASIRGTRSLESVTIEEAR
jgi:hypothetical protein